MRNRGVAGTGLRPPSLVDRRPAAARDRMGRLSDWISDNRIDLAIITAITVLAAVLRIWRLGTVPLGLHGDEAWTGLDARRVLSEGWIGVYVQSAVGQPTGPIYFTALVFKLLSDTTFTLRLSMALFGVATIPVMYAAFAVMFNRTVAAFAALLLTLMMWHLHLSRTGFMVISWPFIEMAVLLVLWHAMRFRSLPLFAVAGVLTGLGIYTYNAYLLFVPLPFIALVWTYARDRRALRRSTFLHVAALVLAGVVVSIPMVVFVARNTDEYRFHQKLVSLRNSEQWKEADGVGEHAHLVWDRADELSRAMLFGGRTDFGDGLATPGHPPIGELLGTLAVMGLIMAVWNWRKPAYAVVLGATVLIPWGALLTVGDGLFRRTLGLAPFVALLAALPLAFVWDYALRWPGRLRYAALLVLLIPAVVGGTTVYQYFGPVQDTIEFRVTYPYPMDAASHYIAGLPKGTFVYFLSGDWSFDYETRRFIAPDAEGVDRSREFRDRSLDPTLDPIDFTMDPDRDVAWVFLYPYYKDLDPLVARYPGGTLTEVSRGPELLFRGYFIPRGSAAAP